MDDFIGPPRRRRQQVRYPRSWTVRDELDGAMRTEGRRPSDD
jgi:hypothetical protein